MSSLADAAIPTPEQWWRVKGVAGRSDAPAVAITIHALAHTASDSDAIMQALANSGGDVWREGPTVSLVTLEDVQEALHVG